MSTDFFDFTLEPGQELGNTRKYNYQEPVISIIMPFYNSGTYIKQTVYSVLNQTFPYFELLIVDDGSKNAEALKELKKIEKLDNRIKVFHKENEGVSAARDYGAEKSASSAKYLFFLDDDDLIENTYLECAYWTLETNKDASWAYTDSLGFEANNYLWNQWFDSEKMKKENVLVATALIRKEPFFDVGGYGIREKAVSEDWNFWLKLIAKGCYPVRMNFYGFWYRRKKGESESKRATKNKTTDMQIIQKTAATINKKVKAIQYPRENFEWDTIEESIDTILTPQLEDKADDLINILMIIPWATTGGADKFNIDMIKGLDKNKFNVTVILTEPQINMYRQELEKYAVVYDVTTFIDEKYWLAFINYIIKSRNINFIINTNSRFGYAILPYLKGKYPETPIIDYIHMEEWYNRNGGYSRDSSSVASVIDKTLLCNKNSENILVEHFKRDRKDLETVYIGVDEKLYDPATVTDEERNKILEKYKIDKHGRYIISFICRISLQKRPHLLIQIIRQLKSIRNDFLVVVAGEGDMLYSIKKEANKYNLFDNIVFIGNIKETKEIYAISDCTLNCSIKEGVALTSYESLAMGVPVVSSDVGGQKELINDKVGKIVPCLQDEEEISNFEYSQEEIQNYVDAINEILNNLGDYKNECRKHILENFTINQMQERMANIIEQIHNNPDEEKINMAEGLSTHLDICKEMMLLFLQQNKKLYKWQCTSYNNNYYDIIDEYSVTRASIIKERLWTYPLWRAFIKFLKKTGIMKILKKLKRKKD